MKQYKDLINKILSEGRVKPSGRENMPDTLFVPSSMITHNLQAGFPLLTTKKMFWKGIVHELLWFLRGETNIKYLVDNNVNIWNGDAYRWYQKQSEIRGFKNKYQNIEEFISDIKNNQPYEVWDSLYRLGDLGKVYGHQWRGQNGIDQVCEIINGLKTNPFSRYHVLDGWNRSDFDEMALPPCHLLYHFISEPNGDDNPRLNLNLYQRSCDVGLGFPFNITSMSLLLMIISKVVGMTPNQITWMGGDSHIYLSHLPMLKQQVERECLPLPTMTINRNIESIEDIENLTVNDFTLTGYSYHPPISMELFTGYKTK